MTFESMMSNGNEFELIPGGRNKKITKFNIEEYIQLVVHLRDGECEE